MLSYLVLLLETFRKAAQPHGVNTGARLSVQVGGQPRRAPAAASPWQAARALSCVQPPKIDTFPFVSFPDSPQG